MGTVSLETCIFHAHDVLRLVLWDIIAGWLQAVCVSVIWVETPRSSWSRACHDLPDGGGPRSKLYIWGKPNLPPADQAIVLFGNASCCFASSLIRAHKILSTLIIIENPHTSMLWDSPSIQRVSHGSFGLTMDFCKFCMP